MVAHEFNNILTPVLNYALLASDGDPVMQEKCARFSLQGAKKACAISKALLALVNNQPCDKSEGVNVAELVQQVLDAMARDPAKDGITLVVKLPAKLSVVTRAAELSQVLLNLLLNARWAVLQKGRGQSIQIEALRDGSEVLLRVSDTGIGIAPENLQRIFEAFFTTRSDNGTGLGLAICKHIVESLGGRLSVRSELGKGTCFTVSLPAENKTRLTRRKPKTTQAIS
jgi:signal transduction histidine kinase